MMGEVSPRWRVGLPRAVLLALVLVWPVFGHGCHSGDHDDELAVMPVDAPEEGRER